VEGDGLGLDFALFHVDFVAAQDDGNVLADADQVAWEMISCVIGTLGEECLRCQLGTFL
jgi:hypothetical protein